MLIEINNISKHYGERKIFELDRFALYAGDKVAITGRNGSGKTTLLKVISGIAESDSGRVVLKGRLAVIPQMDKEDFGELSGGEKMRELIEAAFSQHPDILIADEPTTNLDISGIRMLEDTLCSFKGALLLVSHDRALLKKVCNKVLEIERGMCKLFGCGYAEYITEKEIETTAKLVRYEKYTAEKDRLRRAAQEKANKSAAVKRAPKRMGNSERRLHRMGGQKAKEKLDRSAKAALSRLEKLDKVERPWKQREISFDINASTVHIPVLVKVNDLSRSFGDKTLLEHCSFEIPGAKKTALIGANGTGKTTLINAIISGEESITKYANIRIGYLSQDMRELDDDKSVLENAMSGSVFDQTFVRTILARLLFARDRLDSLAGSLSGGERVLLSMAKIILSDYNLLILDEPTNYLDIESRRALESVLCAYPGAVFFVSHDREFINSVADRIVLIENKQVRTFEDAAAIL